MAVQSPQFSELDQQLDAILVSDDALALALNSENEILRTAARLTASRHPALSASVRRVIWQAINRVVQIYLQ